MFPRDFKSYKKNNDLLIIILFLIDSKFRDQIYELFYVIHRRRNMLTIRPYQYSGNFVNFSTDLKNVKKKSKSFTKLHIAHTQIIGSQHHENPLLS